MDIALSLNVGCGVEDGSGERPVVRHGTGYYVLGRWSTFTDAEMLPIDVDEHTESAAVERLRDNNI